MLCLLLKRPVFTFVESDAQSYDPQKHDGDGDDAPSERIHIPLHGSAAAAAAATPAKTPSIHPIERSPSTATRRVVLTPPPPPPTKPH